MVDRPHPAYARAVLSHAIPVVTALVGALICFGALVSAGAWLIKRLRLPVDLPEGCRFEPSPPEVGPADSAHHRAKAWAQRREACLAAEASYRDALRVHEVLAEVGDLQRAVGDHDRTQLLAQLKPQAERAEQASDEATAAMHDQDVDEAIAACQQRAAEIAELRTAAEALLASLPAPARSHRSLILLVTLAVVVILWVLVVLPALSPGAPG